MMGLMIGLIKFTWKQKFEVKFKETKLEFEPKILLKTKNLNNIIVSNPATW
jgi:hypothetical protein